MSAFKCVLIVFAKTLFLEKRLDTRLRFRMFDNARGNSRLVEHTENDKYHAINIKFSFVARHICTKT